MRNVMTCRGLRRRGRVNHEESAEDSNEEVESEVDLDENDEDHLDDSSSDDSVCHSFNVETASTICYSSDQLSFDSDATGSLSDGDYIEK
jgi:hypothetical protein